MNTTSSKNIYPEKGLKSFVIAAVAALVLAGCGASADVDAEGSTSGDTHTFTLATAAPTGTAQSSIENRYLDLVEERSNGRIEFERTTEEALCAMDEVLECLRSGRADIGTTAPDVTPHLMPSLSIVGVSFLNEDLHATTAALYDLHTNHVPAMELLEQNNLHFITTYPTGRMLVGSQEPVETYEDLNGLRLRATGPITQSSLETAGVNVNALTGSETYEGMQRGVIDSVGADLNFAVMYQITEQAPYWADPGLGHYSSFGMWWNKDSYESLPDDLQGVVDEVTHEMNIGGEVNNVYNEQLGQVCEGMLESPDVESFIRWDEEETQKWHNDVAGNAEEQWIDSANGFGFDAAREYLEEYKTAYSEHASDSGTEDLVLDCINKWQEQNN